MVNFVTFDDELNYFAIREMESLGQERDELNNGGSYIRLRSGDIVHSSWPVQKIVEFLGPVANLHY